MNESEVRVAFAEVRVALEARPPRHEVTRMIHDTHRESATRDELRRLADDVSMAKVDASERARALRDQLAELARDQRALADRFEALAASIDQPTDTRSRPILKRLDPRLLLVAGLAAGFVVSRSPELIELFVGAFL